MKKRGYGVFLFRLQSLGWGDSRYTSTHLLLYKKNWRCSINRDTKQVIFSRMIKVDTADLMRWPVERGIE